jgi:hypothetical protein
METTPTSTHPTTQLDLVRNDAAARQRRATTYRSVHQQRPSSPSTRRVSPLAGLATVLLALGLVGGPAVIAGDDDSPLPHGHEPGRADGWYAPDIDAGTSSTAESSVRSASTPLRTGYVVGRPDGWYEPGTPDVEIAGVTITRPTTGTRPRNVR